MEIDGVKTFGGVIKNGVVDIVNHPHELVTCDGEDHLVGVPRHASGRVGGVWFLAVGVCGTCWDDWVVRRYNIWDVECLPIACQVDCWFLKKA